MMTTTWGVFPSLDRVLDEAFRPAPARGVEPSGFPLAADVREKNDEYTFQIDVPGVKPDNLEITLTDHVLTIKGARPFEARQNEKVTRSRPYGQFVASYSLPESIEGDGLTADLADGVLTIRVPKHPKAQPRRIPIGSGAERKQLSE